VFHRLRHQTKHFMLPSISNGRSERSGAIIGRYGSRPLAGAGFTVSYPYAGVGAARSLFGAQSGMRLHRSRRAAISPSPEVRAKIAAS